MRPLIAATALTCGYGGAPVLDGLDVTIPAGAVTALIGPNGCGKSTLLKAMARLIPSRGEVLLDGVDIRSIRRRDLARRLAVLPQSPTTPAGLSVGDLVARGRHPHQSWVQQWGDDDAAQVRAALRQTGLEHLAHREIGSPSGGQAQRVWVAMTIAQDTPTLFLDEPTTFLDLARGIEVLDLVAALHAEHARTVVMVLHDLNLAARYCDHLIVMDRGRIAAGGAPAEVLTESMLADVFGLRARVIDDPIDGGPLVVPACGRGDRIRLSTRSSST